MTTVSSLVKNIIEPTVGASIWVFTYTKVNEPDTFNVGTGTSLKKILFVKAMLDATGADDPITAISGTTITLSAGTGAGRCLVVGTGQ